MSVRHGRQFLAIPGPTTVPDEVLNAMHRGAIDIYAGDMVQVTDSLLEDLRKIFRTRGHTYIYAANGHGAWEAALANTLSRGEEVLVLESGRFALGWGGMGASMGLEVSSVPNDWRHAVDPTAVEARLREDTAHRIKAVLTVQVDTASGVHNDIAAIRKAMDAAGHPALLMVDTVGSLGIVPFEMDDWGVDVAMSGSQKGLMTPPGLSLVAANDRARAAHRVANLRTRYWDWTEREGSEHYMKYCGTPPEHMLFGLRKAIDLLLDEGLDNAFRRHHILASATRAAVEAWSRGGSLGFNVPEADQRADSVTVVRLGEGRSPDPLVGYCNEQCGVSLGIGIGNLHGMAFRIAHMGHVNAPMLLGTLGTIEMAFNALDWPHGPGGTEAAIRTMAAAVPG